MLEIVRVWPVVVKSLCWSNDDKKKVEMENVYYVRDLGALDEVEERLRNEAEKAGIKTVVRRERRGGFFSRPEKVVETVSLKIIQSVRPVEGGQVAYAVWDPEREECRVINTTAAVILS